MNFPKAIVKGLVCLLPVGMMFLAEANAAIDQNSMIVFPDSGYPSMYSPADNTEVQLMRVTSDVKPGYADFKLILDNDGKITALKYAPNNGEGLEFKADDQLKTGVVILKTQGRNVLILKSSDYDASQGGHFDLIYLSNGITNEMGTFKMELAPKGDSWVLMTNSNSGRREFTQMYMEGRKLFGKVIGIKSITVQ